MCGESCGNGRHGTSPVHRGFALKRRVHTTQRPRRAASGQCGITGDSRSNTASDAFRPNNGPKGVYRALIVRLCTLPVTIVAASLTSFFVVRTYGQSGYAAFALFVTLPSLLPFADLGVGVNVVNAIAGRGGLNGRIVILTRLRHAIVVTLRMAFAGVVVALVVSSLGLWPQLLGGAAAHVGHVSAAATLMLCVFSIGVVSGLGYRGLLGLGRNDQVFIFQACAAVVNALVSVALAATGCPLWCVLAVSSSATVGAGICAAGIVLRSLQIRVRDLIPKQSMPVRGASAGWLIALSCALPVALQSDRVLLSHLGTVSQLAIYSLAAQLFTPGMSLVTAASQSLWPRYVQLRSTGAAHRRMFLRGTSQILGLGALIAGSGLAISPVFYRVIGGHEIRPSFTVSLVFAGFILTMSLQAGFGMYLMHDDDIPFQAKWSIVMAIANLALTSYLIQVVGTTGPVLASLICVFAFITLPAIIRVNRLLQA